MKVSRAVIEKAIEAMKNKFRASPDPRFSNHYLDKTSKDLKEAFKKASITAKKRNL